MIRAPSSNRSHRVVMKLYLIRHSESANNAMLSSIGSEAARVPDPDITERGHRQAQHLAEHLAGADTEPYRQPSQLAHAEGRTFGLTHLYCSLMTRSILTAGYIAQRLDLPYLAHPEIFERGGLYEETHTGERVGVPGPGRSHFAERFPSLSIPEDIDDSGWYRRDAESDEEFFDRVARSLEDVVSRHADSDDRVAMVVHGDYIDQAVNHFMGTSRIVENYAHPWMGNWALHNTSITRVDVNHAARVVVYTNRLDHLPAELVSW